MNSQSWTYIEFTTLCAFSTGVTVNMANFLHHQAIKQILSKNDGSWRDDDTMTFPGLSKGFVTWESILKRFDFSFSLA